MLRVLNETNPTRGGKKYSLRSLSNFSISVVLPAPESPSTETNNGVVLFIATMLKDTIK